jgi:uncharacterized protein YceH (UPF0502 family)
MIELTRDECRILGVLVEMAHTTPAGYPLTLNGLITGCNQKSNRNPVVKLSEDNVLEALDSLRGKGLVREVMLSGSRVQKFKHNAREVLGVETSELIVLTELLLRGAQTTGEIRGRASRMHQLDSIDVVDTILQTLMERQMVERLPPAAGSRAATYGQLLCPALRPAREAAQESPAPSAAPAAPADPGLADRVSRLENEVAELRSQLQQLQAVLDVARPT